MAKKNRASGGGTAIEPHVERAISVVTGRPILIRCECPLGHDHTYAEWRECFGDPASGE